MLFTFGVILSILKIIGIIIISLLGLLLFLLLLFLFIPIRYHIIIQMEQKVKIDAKIGWFFRFVFFHCFKREDKLVTIGRIMRIPIYDSRRPKKEKKKKEKKKKEKKRKPPIEEKDELVALEVDSSSNKLEEKEEKVEQRKPLEQEEETTQDRQPEQEKKLEQEDVLEEQFSTTNKYKENQADKKGGMWNKISQKIKGIPKKIKEIKQKIIKFFSNLSTSKEKLVKFISDETNQAAFLYAYHSILKFGKHIFPMKILGNIYFGTGDPCFTGQILAVLGMTYRIHKGSIDIIPDFEQTIFKGEIDMQGRIRLFTIFIISIRVFLNKNIKQLIRNIKEEFYVRQ